MGDLLRTIREPWKVYRTEIATKDFDVGIRYEHFAIEFFSPERNAVPLIVPTEGATEAQVQRQMFDGIRRGNAQSESLIMQANTKLHSKNADRYGGFLLLLMDTRGNDLLEDYFNDGEFAVGRIRDELAAPIRSATIGRNPPVLNLFVERPGFILAIAERTSWRLSHIHLMNGSAEQLRQIQRVFWLSKVTLD